MIDIHDDCVFEYSHRLVTFTEHSLYIVAAAGKARLRTYRTSIHSITNMYFLAPEIIIFILVATCSIRVFKLIAGGRVVPKIRD